MNIVILGAGNVGKIIAEMLCQHEHVVTIVDRDPDVVRRLNEELDCRALLGSASQSSIMFQAGIINADVCLAVTGSDETNIVAASMAKSMGARRAIARIYAPVFHDLSTFDYQGHFGIDRMLSLEHLCALELARSIRTPGSLVIEQFTRGDLQVQELTIGQESNITRNQIRDLGLPSNVRVGTIQRDHRMWIASAEDQFEIGDKVTVFFRPEALKVVRTTFKRTAEKARRVVIAGGGETGLHLARILERERFKVMVIEPDADRCQVLAAQLEHSSVINLAATDLATFEEMRIGNADVFVATTGDDEDNMVMCVRANELGTKETVATIKRPDYSRVVERLGIDTAVSDFDVMAKQILSYMTEGIVISKTKLPGGLMSVIELEVAVDSPATESTVADLGLPDRCLIVAVAKHDEVRMPGPQDRFAANDTVILLLEDDVIDAALALFSPT